MSKLQLSKLTKSIQSWILLLVVIITACTAPSSSPSPGTAALLSEPFLQLPTPTSIRVVWFTEFPGKSNTVAYGENFKRTVAATTNKLSHVQEDQNSKVGNQTQNAQIYKKPTQRNIWRHEAIIDKLTGGTRVPYRVTSIQENGKIANSATYTLTSNPKAGTPLKILLTSDHQLKPLVAANLQKVVETVGKIDAVFLAGDTVNIADRASEWFDDNRGGAFFPCLQGRGSYEISTQDKNKIIYKGAELIQSAPLFTAIGNHEVMGRFSTTNSLNEQFDDTKPHKFAIEKYKNLKLNENSKKQEKWLKDNSFNTDTYEEIFTLPQSKEGNEKYYAVTFGDVRLVVLYAANMWRTPSLDAGARGKYRERDSDLNQPDKWGYGQYIFEPISKGSTQYNWLQKELNSQEFRQAKYKLVMLHYPPHSLGDNIVPAYTDPVQAIERDKKGSIKAIRYEYPLQADYLIRDVSPLLEKSGVQLVYYGHSHLWNRFVSKTGMHFLESSNVGNTYGAFLDGQQRSVPVNYKEKYTKTGNPNGLKPVIPTSDPLKGSDGKIIPYVASNDITVFSIFDTANGMVSSYRFDTQKPSLPVVKFDEFKLK